MINDFDKVIAALNYLGLRPDINEYRWRFLIQKTTYLAQSLGIEMDYPFTIYVGGPYSPVLTSDYYQRSNQLASLQTDYVLTSSDIARLERIRECCDLYEDLTLMEATSTIVFIMKETPNIRDDEILVRIRSLKPYLNDFTLVVGMSRAKKLLFRPEYLTEELKKEHELWDKIES